MSGIVGIANMDDAPVDRPLLARMTNFLTYRGPDAQEIYSEGHVGFGHTMLRTTWESEREQQPCSLDGKVWITADARVDGRRDLIGKLESHGRNDLRAAPDAELILHAYHVWGEDCLRHLVGDFAFAIWDGRNQRLFCARDHFGVKPFYYARVGSSVIFSNTLDCIRLHPNVSDELNDLAIADFLLFDDNREPGTTSFAKIQRLGPGHYCTWSPNAFALRCYWSLPVNTEIYYKRAYEYVDHFRELLEDAVSDRMRTNRIGAFMSGGLDSTAVTAVAQTISKRAGPVDLRAFTTVFDPLIPDQERKYSKLAVQCLDIPIRYLDASDYQPYERREEPKLWTPEPDSNSLLELEQEQYRQLGEHSRVALTGIGGDSIFLPSGSYVRGIFKNLQFGRFLSDVSTFVLSRRGLPHLGVRTMLKRWLGIDTTWHPFYPKWLNPALVDQLRLVERWEHVEKSGAPIDTLRPEAHQNLSDPVWQRLFERMDPGASRFPVESRHPLLDVRVVTYLLRVPSMPWCQEKNLLRAMTRDILPDPVRCRPKTTLGSIGEPVFEHIRKADSRWLASHFRPVPALSKYVDADAVPLTVSNNLSEFWTNLRPLSLNYWLSQPRA